MKLKVLAAASCSCALLMTPLASRAGLESSGPSGNWMSLPGGMQIDVDSANTLPSGVTTFRFRSLVQNPIDRSHFWTYMAKAIDCKTVETVNLTKGTREPFSPWQGEFTMKTPFSAIGYRLFC